jgi:hypothetical protein
MNYIVGIDPGVAGAICVLSESKTIVDLVTMPKDCLMFDRYMVSYKHEIRHVFLEKARAISGQRISSMATFNYGQGFGEMIGVLTSQNIPFTLVPPQTWQKIIHAGTDTHLSAKERTLQAIKRLYPEERFLLKPKLNKNDFGLLDALAIADYGFKTL